MNIEISSDEILEEVETSEESNEGKKYMTRAVSRNLNNNGNNNNGWLRPRRNRVLI